MASSALALYNGALQRRPLTVKIATSATLSGLAQLVGSCISGSKVDARGVLAYIIYGGAIAGTAPHFFYSNLDRLAGPKASVLKKLLLERVTLAPFMTATVLFVTRVLKGESLRSAFTALVKIFPGAMVKNWQFWTPAILVNLLFMPVQYRTLFTSCVAFVWTVYLATLSRKPQPQPQPKPAPAPKA